MSTPKQSVHLVHIVLIAMICVLVTYEATGRRSTLEPSSAASTVATVSLMRVMDGLTERGEAEIELRRLRDEMESEAELRRSELEAMRDALANEPAGPSLEQKRDELEQGLIKLQYWIELKREQLDVEFSLQLQQLYRNIKESIAEIAESNGYDLVIVDDAEGEIMVQPDARISREAQVRQQIASRRLLYTSDAVDVTDALIQRMNNRYATGTP